MFVWTKSDAIVLPLVLLGIILSAVGLHFLLRNKNKWLRKLPLMLIAVFVLAMEIAKQAFYAGKPEFNFYVLPLHFCSLFVLLFPLSQLCGEKVGKIFKPLSFCYAIAVMFLMYTNPKAIIGYSTANPFGNFQDFHTFFFHHALVFYVCYSIALDDYKPKFMDCLNVALGVVVYACYAAPSAFALNSNYANILFSGVEILEKFRLWAGQAWYDVVLFVIGIGSMVLICLLYNLVYKAVAKKIVQKREKEKQVSREKING